MGLYIIHARNYKSIKKCTQKSPFSRVNKSTALQQVPLCNDSIYKVTSKLSGKVNAA